MNDIDHLKTLLTRSAQYEEALFSLFPDSAFPENDKSIAITTMCNIALEHSVGVRVLIDSRILTSAMSLLRLQYEAVVRAVWLLYVASDSSISKLVAPLSKETEQAASNSLPSFSIMMSEIEKKAHCQCFSTSKGIQRLFLETSQFICTCRNSCSYAK